MSFRINEVKSDLERSFVKQIFRPWGFMNQFAFNQKCTVKILCVQPYQELSLQYHNNREEHWYVLSEGYIQLGDEIKPIRDGDLIVIKKEMPHRLIAVSKELKVLEVSFGEFDENDEVRIFDSYGRKLDQVENGHNNGSINIEPENLEKEDFEKSFNDYLYK